MPVYNGEMFIREALDSLLAQTFTDFELIISDNASTDKTQEICLAYAQRDPRIRYVRQNENKGALVNFQFVLDQARGDFFMWAAADDRWESSFIMRLAQSLDTNPQAVLASCQFSLVNEDGSLARTPNVNWADVFSRSKFFQFVFMALSDEISSRKANHIYGLLRREALLECGGMSVFVNTSMGEDILCLLRLLAKWDFTIVDQILFHYRVRPLPARHNKPLLGYIWQRITYIRSNRRGLFFFFRDSHSYHSYMRKIIVNETSLSPFEKLLLWLAIAFKEVWFSIFSHPYTWLRGLRIFKRIP